MGDLHELVINSLTAQLHREYEASMFYRQAYHWFDLHLLPGTASYFRKESADELTHAHLIEDYMLKRSATIVMRNV